MVEIAEKVRRLGNYGKITSMRLKHFFSRLVNSDVPKFSKKILRAPQLVTNSKMPKT